MAKLFFYYGTMGAGKSAELLMCNDRYIQADKKVLLMKAKDHTRDDEYIKSRTGMVAKIDYFVEDFLAIPNYEELLNNIDVIIIDEIQFCKTNVIDTLSDIVDKLDIPVICYGLKTNSDLHIFEGAKRLIEIADSIIEIKNICIDCGNKAIINILISGDAINGKYQAYCRKCVKKLNKNYLLFAQTSIK